MILSIIAALFGSGFGGAARSGVDAAAARLETGEGPGQPVVVNASLVAALVAGIVCSTFGRSLRTTFWVGAVLGAAGADRLDLWVLRRFGVDPERLVAQARSVAERQASRARSRVEETAEGL